MAVAVVLHALTPHRPCRGAWTVAEALAEIARGSGTHFDPAIVRALHTCEVCDLAAGVPSCVRTLLEAV